MVAIDPVNFEKPYTHKLEGVSTVYKSTPPNLDGEKRLARGYPAITASVVNMRVPGICYANWFSYKTSDFISQNREIQRAVRTTRWVFPDRRIRFVMDAGGDDQKVFAWMNQFHCEFVIVASHLERLVEVYNDRLDRRETEHLQDLVDSAPWMSTFQAAFLMRVKHDGLPSRLVGSGSAYPIPTCPYSSWSSIMTLKIALLSSLPMRPLSLKQMPSPSTLTGACGARSSMDIVLTKNKAWMLKTCGFRPSNACADSLLLS